VNPRADKEIVRGYDTVGNLTAVTPPERPVHELGYIEEALVRTDRAIVSMADATPGTDFQP
jgi:YD repeat-containing protein